MPRLPAPPLPKILLPKPKRPGGGEDTGALSPAEAGTTVVDWVDERTSLSPGLRWLLFRKVPRGTNWAYTLGSATLFAFISQAVTGVFLAMYYRPDAAGGNEFGATTLSRFYSIHMLLVPGAIIALIGVHLYLVSKLGTTAPPWLKPEHEDPVIQDIERAEV